MKVDDVKHVANRARSTQTPSGITCCGELHWGAHFCHLYETREDLIDTLVPFFLTGLVNNEKCLWVTSEPLDAVAAAAALEKQMPDLSQYASSGQLQIVDYTEWYSNIGKTDGDSVLQAWIDAEQQALAEGFNGLRVTGNVTFIKSQEEWRAFEQYEARVTETFAGRRILGLCSYHLGMTSSRDLLDVVHNHEFAVARRQGDWQMIENAAIKLAKQDLHKANFELEQRVATRTNELRSALATVEEQKRELEAVLHMRDESQRQLEAELADAQLLHSVSAALVNEGVVSDFYQKLVDAAALVMRSDFATIQRLDPDRNALEIIVHHGFDDEALAFWDWVPALRPTSCGMALHLKERFIVSDFEAWDYAAGSDDLAAFRAGGVRAAQSTPLLSRSGKLLGMISTHWKRPHQPSERDLRLLDIIARQAADLIDRNAVANALREKAERLIEADRRKDEFLAMLAHELRNPLAPISAAADLMAIGQINEEHVKKTSAIISRQVKHMTGLVDDLLDVSRVTRGLVALDKTDLDARQIVSDAVEQVRPLMESRRHYFSVHLPPETAYVSGDQKRLVQVLTNLLNNAAKYTPEGGNIALKMAVKDNDVELRVVDNGIGMSAQMTTQAFELFAQAERTSDRTQGGLGLGLALVKSLCELHHGSVEAYSRGSGQGSEFTVTLPRVLSAAQQDPQTRDDGKTATANGKRLLVVDDNIDAATMLAMLLEASGHEVMVEHDPRLALERARIEKPDVCLVDVGLPGMDGNELAQKIRRLPEMANVVLIAVTGYGHEKDRRASAAAGFDHHLVKPVDTSSLIKVLGQNNS
ncbi:MEDS domain-containing protein [Noviherbaspirillum sp. ST9]|uniref:hybrid sensor histidine kinase/response regulator n=1 Tax=Noviherbaspirillum sp. ST9 TaxID=3401606 RepID=UPI003B589B31